MAHSDIVLRFVACPDADTRTFRVLQVLEHAAEELELYKFSHPATGLPLGTTTFYRKNLDTLVFETAGQIEWLSNFVATVCFGVDEVSVKELRKVKNGGRSRRFKAAGMGYKWKLQENESGDMFCIDSNDRHVATWTARDGKLKVAPRCVAILDRIVVTCFLNLWFRSRGRW